MRHEGSYPVPSILISFAVLLGLYPYSPAVATSQQSANRTVFPVILNIGFALSGLTNHHSELGLMWNSHCRGGPIIVFVSRAERNQAVWCRRSAILSA